MNLYLLSQEANRGYDTYSDCVVCSSDADDAKKIHPSGEETKEIPDTWDSWCSLKDVCVEYIGVAKEGLNRGVICASFHAG